MVAEGGGTFVANERLGRRRLAYPISKHKDGVYVRFLYDAEPRFPRSWSAGSVSRTSVLRALTVRLEPNWAVAAKEQAVRDAEARVEAARARALSAPERADACGRRRSSRRPRLDPGPTSDATTIRRRPDDAGRSDESAR